MLKAGAAFAMGPAVLRPDDTLVQFSANPESGKNDMYKVTKQKWSSGPAMVSNNIVYVCNDAPAALLPDGNVLASHALFGQLLQPRAHGVGGRGPDVRPEADGLVWRGQAALPQVVLVHGRSSFRRGRSARPTRRSRPAASDG